MNSHQQTHETILQEMERDPWNLNRLTQQYLKYLSQCSSNPRLLSWQSVEFVMRQTSNQRQPISRSVLLMNVIKTIVNQTFAGINSFKDNRIYCWFGMLYGCKSNQLITQTVGLVHAARTHLMQDQSGLQQNKSVAYIYLDKPILQHLCYGLLVSEILIGLVENTNRRNASNKVIYPQFYHLLSFGLESLQMSGAVDPSVSILVNQQINEQQPSGNQQSSDHQQYHSQQNGEQTKKETEQSKSYIRVTQILKMIENLQMHTNSKKKQKSQQNKMDLNCVQYKKIIALMTAKIVELLTRSFSMAKIKQVKHIHLVKQEINSKLKQLIQSQKETIQPDQNKECKTLAEIIKDYLGGFGQSKQNQNKPAFDIEQQIDQQNKIIQVKQLTPRFNEEGTIVELKKLRMKKKKLIKKIESDARTAKLNKLQEQRVLMDVRNERVAKKQKKQLFVMQKQTQQAKKQHNKMKRVKKIQKSGKKSNSKTYKFQGKAKRK